MAEAAAEQDPGELPAQSQELRPARAASPQQRCENRPTRPCGTRSRTSRARAPRTRVSWASGRHETGSTACRRDSPPDRSAAAHTRAVKLARADRRPLRERHPDRLGGVAPPPRARAGAGRDRRCARVGSPRARPAAPAREARTSNLCSRPGARCAVHRSTARPLQANATPPIGALDHLDGDRPRQQPIRVTIGRATRRDDHARPRREPPERRRWACPAITALNSSNLSTAWNDRPMPAPIRKRTSTSAPDRAEPNSARR